MKQFKLDQGLFESIVACLKEKGSSLSFEEAVTIANGIGEEVLEQYVDRLINQAETILEIDPSLGEKEILETLAKKVVEYLGAVAASIRIYDPAREEMISFGSYPNVPEDREQAIPFEDTIAGEVVRTRRSYFVPNILNEERYNNKEKIRRHGIHSMLAVPISIPRFSLRDLDTEGVLQIYYKEEDKIFTRLEAMTAEMLSRRVSYVIARKRIMDLQQLNMTKDKIVEQIFQKLGRREGIKVKDVFNRVIPELVDIMRVQRCALFCVSEDRTHVVLEAGFPERLHGLGKVFDVKVPYIDAIVNQTGPFGEFESEKIYPAYILISEPRKSRLLPPDLQRFLEIQQINSVLYVPLRVNHVVKYFLVFDAQAQHQRFTDGQIEILTFFGKELMKGLRLEKMDDILHDFKNPAIAAAGFARRALKILENGEYPSKREKVHQALDIILKETSRIQELALTLHMEGREGEEQIIDLTEKLKHRFLINEEAIQELLREDIHLVEGSMQPFLWIRCFPIQIERVLDNLFMNATQAIPEQGGDLSIRSYRKDSWAVAEITNTGQIPERNREQYLLGEGKGRGIHITTRLVNRMEGKMEVESEAGQTTFRVMFPLVGEEPA